MQQFFNALVAEELENGTYKQSIKQLVKPLPSAGETLVKVYYSSLNYKDALSASGNKGVTKNYPHTPGIDAAGVIVETDSKMFQVGDEVVVMGYDLGMNTAGGFSEYIQVPEDWIIKLPQAITLRESMIYGTAGITAGLLVQSVLAINNNLVKENEQKVVVTGATGGVGSIAVAILNKLGYEVVALTRKKEQEEKWLLNIGATSVLSALECQTTVNKRLLNARWLRGIDTVGGVYLDYILKATSPNGIVACCGNIGGHNVSLSIYPFILRAVALKGVDAANCQLQMREEILTLLATTWRLPQIEKRVNEISLRQLPQVIGALLAGEHTGRTIIKIT